MIKRFFAAVFSLVIVVSAIPSVGALGTLPAVNEQVRHVLCDSLSETAQAYYTAGYSYDALSALSGAQDISTSYDAMQNNALFSALHDLMSGTHRYYTSYSGYQSGSLAYFWQRTDAVESSNTYVMFYSDVMANEEGISLNREHIWPKSRASFNTAYGGADLHHLRPSVSTLNSAKSDHLFGNIVTAYADGYTVGSVKDNVCYWVKKDADLFECKDDVKGDVARILLYVYCRWEQPNLYSDTDLELLPTNDSGSTNNGKRVVESLDTLLSWCEDDPVDTWEMRRNDLIEEVQGNRNVFIDYPELAWQLFDREAPVDMPTPSGHGRELLLGDSDGDGAVTIADVSMIQTYLLSIQTDNLIQTAADVDRDGMIEVDDATFIQRHLVKIAVPVDGIGLPIGE